MELDVLTQLTELKIDVCDNGESSYLDCLKTLTGLVDLRVVDQVIADDPELGWGGLSLFSAFRKLERLEMSHCEYVPSPSQTCTPGILIMCGTTLL